MSLTVLLFSIAVVWCLIGILVSIWMRRRGHALFTWAYLGAVLGPLVVPLAIDAIARERRAGVPALRPMAPDHERVSMLVGIDGSAESLAAAEAAVALFAERIGRLTLAAVIDYDAANGGPSESRRAAEAHLDAAALAIAFARPDREILVGAPADVLGRAARDGAFDVLVIGNRGRGASRAVLGSVASQLARGAGVPVLVGDVASMNHLRRSPEEAAGSEPP